jgi:hypothetical protein
MLWPLSRCSGRRRRERTLGWAKTPPLVVGDEATAGCG